ncbi:tyrosine-type recombinase/integrase [Ornithinibacillus xuwenensis]|uniref:Site-specific integrase n=1 Tax=Ornithinibacillus xuwenensis TaxID=3144668 RepID=A0ABU9XKM7_9BACI
MEEKSTLFKDFALEWLKIYSHSRDVKPGTVRVRNHEIDKLMPYFAYLKLTDITLKKYQDTLNDLKEKYANNTLDGIHRTGRMIFRKAVEMEIVIKDPTEFAVIKKEKKAIEELEKAEVPRYLEKNELALFLETAAFKGLDMDYLVFLILSYTGMRVGELVSLKWNDIDFPENTVRIIKTYYNPTNNTVKYQLVPPKTKGSVRRIVIDDIVIEALKRHKETQEKVKRRIGNTYYNKDFIFANSCKYPGYPILIKTVENRMKRLLKIAKLNQELTPHSLRHTHTSLLAEAKVGLEEIMDRLGHTEDRTTRNIYLHVTKELKKEASQKFGQLMRSLQ